MEKSKNNSTSKTEIVVYAREGSLLSFDGKAFTSEGDTAVSRLNALVETHQAEVRVLGGRSEEFRKHQPQKIFYLLTATDPEELLQELRKLVSIVDSAYIKSPAEDPGMN